MDVQQEAGPWRNKSFRVLAGGHMVNAIGESMYAFALPLLALSFTGSLAAMSLLVAVTPFLLAVSGPLLGHLVDRYGSRFLAVPGLLLQLVTSLLFNLALMSGEPPLWSLYVTQVLVQVGAVSYRAGLLPGIPVMFPESPGRARGSLSMLFNVSLVVGPALSAVLVGVIGFQGLLWINTITFLAPLAVWFSGINPVAGQEARGRQARTPVLQSLREGMQVFLGSSRMRAILAVMVPMSLVFSMATVTLFVYFAQSWLGANSDDIGISLAVANIGGLTGAVFTSEIPRWSIRTVAMLALLSATACLLIIALGESFILATIALTIFMACDMALSVAAEMVMFNSIQPHLIGRVMGIWRLVIFLPALMGSLLIAGLANFVNTVSIFLILAAASVAPLVWLLLNRTALREESE